MADGWEDETAGTRQKAFNEPSKRATENERRVKRANLICGLRHVVSTGSGSDRVTIQAIPILAINCDPVATAPGTDLVP